MDSLAKFKWSFYSVSLFVCNLVSEMTLIFFVVGFPLVSSIFIILFFTIIRIVYLIYVPQHILYVCVCVSLERFKLMLMFHFVCAPIWLRCDKQNAKHQAHHIDLLAHTRTMYAFHSLVINKYNYCHCHCSEYMQTIGNNRQVPPIHCSFAITLWNCACYCNPCSKQASSASPAKRTNEYTHINEWEKNSSRKNNIHNGKTEDSRSTGEERSGVCVVSILTSIHLKVF